MVVTLRFLADIQPVAGASRYISMKGIALAFAIMMAGGCAQDAAEKMKLWTDIDLTKQAQTVSLAYEKDLDQVGYNIMLNNLQDRQFLDEIEKLSGKMCMDFVSSGEGCHYRSKLGHDVFISKVGPGNYRIYTSG